jgi:DNA-directed RNA polymerase II subunit RPB1
LSYNNKELETNLCFNDIQIKKLSQDTKLKLSDLENFNKDYMSKLLYYRDEMRKIFVRATMKYKYLEEKFMLPVNLFRITQDYTNKKELTKIDLLPSYIIDKISEFLNDCDNRLITLLNKNDNLLKKDDLEMKFLLQIALYEYLAPVKCIFYYKLTKDRFDEMMKDIKMSFIKSLIEPGEMVGVIAAQSIGEPTSQLTLNTKHSAGSKSAANMGVNRILELLHYSKNPKNPQMIVYLKPEYRNDKNTVNKITSGFKHLTIRQLINSAEIYYDLGLNDKQSNIIKNDNVSAPFFVNNQKANILSLPFVFRIKFNLEKLMHKETTLLDIKTKFISHWYKHYSNVKSQKKSDKDIISKITRCAILSNLLTDSEPIIHIRFNMTSFNNNIIVDFIKMIFDDITLKGIENIDSIETIHEKKMDFDEKTGDIISNNEYVVYTVGINFEKLRFIKGIDMTRTKCNDVATTLRLYGIEATRQILISEIAEAYDSGGSNINQTHLSLLVDQMCHLGEVISIDRHGLSKIDLDPIARASFEQSMEHFVKAAIFNEKDHMKSVSSRVAIGRVIPGGTGAFDLLLNTKKIEESEYIEDETSGRIKFIKLEEEPLFEDIINHGLGKTKFFIP